MFTGIIEEIGVIKKINNKNGKRYFTINCQRINSSLKIGSSVASNGICLTIIDFNEKQIIVEAMQETILKTSVRFWKLNDEINLERATKMNDRLDGHIVQGHIDTIAEVQNLSIQKNTLYIEIKFSPEFANLIVPQGSIAVNGVSLTIAKITRNSFVVAIIGHTIENTNLQKLKRGKYVNIEFDIIGKYILRNVNTQKKGLTEEYLIEKGF